MKGPVLFISCLLCSGLQASDCDFEKEIDQSLDLSGSSDLLVSAAAGELEIKGVENSSTAVIKGRVCVSKEEWLEGSGVETRGGDSAEINVVLNKDDEGWSFSGHNYAYLDLELEVPRQISLEVKDSSGAMRITGAGNLAVQDSSGEIRIKDNAGSISIEDSSGDIEITHVEGDVTIVSDSSGEIWGEDIEGSVRVERDSSGDIRFRGVSNDFIVERDSSGDITATDVGGDFRVLRDGSGDVSAHNVSGEVDIPDGK
jgi:hypothetical protein